MVLRIQFRIIVIAIVLVLGIYAVGYYFHGLSKELGQQRSTVEELESTVTRYKTQIDRLKSQLNRQSEELENTKQKATTTTTDATENKKEDATAVTPPPTTPVKKEAEEAPAAVAAATTSSGRFLSDDEEVGSWYQYGRSDYFRKCFNDFGMDLIFRWRKAKQLYCTPTTSSSPSSVSGGTSIYCHKIQQTRHTATDNFCYFENLYYKPRDRQYVASCNKDNTKWSGYQEFQLGLGDFMRNQVHTGSVDPQSVKSECTVKDRTIVMIRDGSGNVFHSAADLINIVHSLMIYNKDGAADNSDYLSNNKIVILDNDGKGPFWPLFDAFSKKGLYYGMQELIDSDSKFKGCDAVRFEHLIFNVPGGSNNIWKDVWKPNECQDAHFVLNVYIRHVLQHLKLSQDFRDSSANGFDQKKIHILLSSRAQKGGSSDRIGRKITNENELVNLIKNSLQDPYGNSLSSNIELTVVDLGSVGIVQQIEYLRKADIYIGMHGAGMTHLMWLPDEAVVIELFPYGWHQSSMRNLAKNLNKIYLAWQNSHQQNHMGDNLWTKVDESEFKTIVQSAIHIRKAFFKGEGL